MRVNGLDKAGRLEAARRLEVLRARREAEPARRLNPPWPWTVQAFDAEFFGVAALTVEERAKSEK